MIRWVKLEDASAILAIYTPYILNSTITFEKEVPTLEKFQQRIEMIQNHYPYIVYEQEHHILGYAYASTFREREAFDHTCELSVYLKDDAKGKGIGSLLMDTLLKLLEIQGFHKAYSVVTYPNEASQALHQRFGFKEVGYLKETGYKFDRWLDVVFLEKTLCQDFKTLKDIHEVKEIWKGMSL